MFGLGDICDKINSAIDDLTGCDVLGDIAATGFALATGQYDEVAQHGLDALEDGFEYAGYEDAAQFCKRASEAVDFVSDIYNGRYAEALRGGAKLYGELAGDNSVSGARGGNEAGSTKPDEAGAYWTERVLADGTQGYMDALLRGDESAKAALKNPEFMAILQQKMKEENQLITMISNLIDVQHRSAMASINNMRV